ncbi:hypothetical protein [Kitasatospora purpeofusca]|uniref:hypothetical protein n=1 Tax=Kitasatospora purpeofusca TaxID=67352 RepID=UPI0038631A2A
MADAQAYTLTIILPPEDVRAIVTYATGLDPGPPTAEAYRRAGEEVQRVAEAAVTGLLRRTLDFRPLSAAVTIRTEGVDPNAPIPFPGPADPA